MEELDYKNLNIMTLEQPHEIDVSLTGFLDFSACVNIIHVSIETNTRNNVLGLTTGFLLLEEYAKVPDHNTIARFRNGRLSGIVEGLFSQLVVKLSDLGEIQYETSS